MSLRPPRRRTAAALLLLLGLLAGCRGTPSRRPPVHPNPNMDDQPRYDAQEASPHFANGAVAQPPVESTVARGRLIDDEVLATGRSFWSGFATEPPVEMDPATRARGAVLFATYCAPCHGAVGRGGGPVAERGRLAAPDLTRAATRDLPVGRLFAVIGEGTGLMPGYAWALDEEDRWAVAAHVRDLGAAAE